MKKNISTKNKICIVLLAVLMGNIFPYMGYAEDNNNESSLQVEPLDYRYTNINDLPVNLLEDIDVVPMKKTRSNILAEGEGFSAEGSFKSDKIIFNDIEENEIIVSIDDPDLEFNKNKNGTMIFTNKEEDYSVENQILDGGFRKIFSIESDEAPKEFKIDIDMEEGYNLLEKEGLYYITDSDNNIIYNIGSAWAVDSLGNFIQTHYEIRGDSFYQVVDYTGDNYPLKADPLFCSDTINNTKTKWDSSYSGGKGTFSVYANSCTKAYITATWSLISSNLSTFAGSLLFSDMWSEVSSDADFKKIY